MTLPGPGVGDTGRRTPERAEWTSTARLRWWPAPAAAAAASVAAAALLAAVAAQRPELLILAAGPLAMLALAPRAVPPAAMRVRVSVIPSRVAEDDSLTLAVEVSTDLVVDHLSLRLRPALPLAAPVEPAVQVGIDSDRLAARWELRPVRWGQWPVGTVDVAIHTSGRRLRASAAIRAGTCVVYPRIAAVRALPRPARLPRLAGDHTAAETGSGVEFAGARPYRDGDPARLVHWSTSARWGRLYVTERHAERLADVVLMLDGYSDVGRPPQSSLDTAVRLSASLAAGYLRAGDRVGAIVLGGGAPRSVPLGLGRTQLARIVELLLQVRQGSGVVDPNLDLLPRRALPPRALVLVASPLLDERMLDVLGRLQGRGTPSVVLDVLDPATVRPADSGPIDTLAVRLWRLDRAAMLARLRARGVVVVPAASLAELSAWLVPHRNRVLAGSRP